MNRQLRQAVESCLASKFGASARIVSTHSLSGGCINNACQIVTDSGDEYFLKYNESPLPGLFEREMESLETMRAAGCIRVPEPIAVGGGAQGVPPFILMEFIRTGRPTPDFQAEMGRRLARMHQQSRADRFGFPHDNYLGSTPQANGWMADWVEFWRERRLGPQLAMAKRKRLTDAHFDSLGEKLMERLPELIKEPDEPPCLLHGDLWSGNYLADEAGNPVLIDPACYYGRREADLAMTLLFGGFTRNFYAGYNEVWPLAPGSEVRLEVYKLYHLLNHLNLFGGGYYRGCVEGMRRVLGV